MTTQTVNQTIQQSTRDALSTMAGIKSLCDAELVKVLEQLWFKGFLYSQACTNSSAMQQIRQDAFQDGAHSMIGEVIRAARPYGFRFVSGHPEQARMAALQKFLDCFSRFHSLTPDNNQQVAAAHWESIPDVRDLHDVGITPRHA